MTEKKPKKAVDERVKELYLLFLSLSGWEEESRNNPGEKLFFSWKNNFDILNSLESDQHIHQIRNGNSVILTQEGLKKAAELQKKYLGA